MQTLAGSSAREQGHPVSTWISTPFAVAWLRSSRPLSPAVWAQRLACFHGRSWGLRRRPAAREAEPHHCGVAARRLGELLARLVGQRIDRLKPVAGRRSDPGQVSTAGADGLAEQSLQRPRHPSCSCPEHLVALLLERLLHLCEGVEPGDLLGGQRGDCCRRRDDGGGGRGGSASRGVGRLIGASPTTSATTTPTARHTARWLVTAGMGCPSRAATARAGSEVLARNATPCLARVENETNGELVPASG